MSPFKTRFGRYASFSFEKVQTYLAIVIRDNDWLWMERQARAELAQVVRECAASENAQGQMVYKLDRVDLVIEAYLKERYPTFNLFD